MAETRKPLILWVEDDATTALLLRTIVEEGKNDIAKASNISSAMDRVLDEPGIKYFSYIVIDLDVPYDERDFTDDELEQLRLLSKTSRAKLSGWIWFKNYIVKVHPDFDLSRIIIYSQYINDLPKSEKDQYCKIRGFISKTIEGQNDILKILGINL
jgi:CheY-like chemotaxis protein